MADNVKSGDVKLGEEFAASRPGRKTAAVVVAIAVLAAVIVYWSTIKAALGL